MLPTLQQSLEDKEYTYIWIKPCFILVNYWYRQVSLNSTQWTKTIGGLTSLNYTKRNFLLISCCKKHQCPTGLVFHYLFSRYCSCYCLVIVRDIRKLSIKQPGFFLEHNIEVGNSPLSLPIYREICDIVWYWSNTDHNVAANYLL